MVLRVSAAANILLYAGKIVDPRRVQRLAAEPFERRRFDDAPLNSGSLDQQLEIALVRKEVWVDPGGIPRVPAIQSYSTPTVGAEDVNMA